MTPLSPRAADLAGKLSTATHEALHDWQLQHINEALLAERRAALEEACLLVGLHDPHEAQAIIGAIRGLKGGGS